MGSIVPHRTTFSAVSRVLRQFLQTRPCLNRFSCRELGRCFRHLQSAGGFLREGAAVTVRGFLYQNRADTL